jgi:hypothetical protein
MFRAGFSRRKTGGLKQKTLLLQNGRVSRGKKAMSKRYFLKSGYPFSRKEKAQHPL